MNHHSERGRVPAQKGEGNQGTIRMKQPPGQGRSREQDEKKKRGPEKGKNWRESLPYGEMAREGRGYVRRHQDGVLYEKS